MNISIYTNKIKNSCFKDLQKEYLERIKKFCNIKIESNKAAKSNKIFNINISKNLNTISSVDFAKKINDITISGYSNINFYTGDKYNDFPDFEMSVTNMDISDEMELSMLIEQIYRAFKINNNEVYHK